MNNTQYVAHDETCAYSIGATVHEAIANAGMPLLTVAATPATQALIDAVDNDGITPFGVSYPNGGKPVLCTIDEEFNRSTGL